MLHVELLFHSGTLTVKHEFSGGLCAAFAM